MHTRTGRLACCLLIQAFRKMVVCFQKAQDKSMHFVDRIRSEYIEQKKYGNDMWPCLETILKSSD